MTARRLGGILCGLLFAGCTWGDTILDVGGSGGIWQPFPPSLTEGAPGSPYWDNASQDAPQGGIGYFVTGQSPYPNQPGLSNPQWLGSSSTAAPSSIVFQSTGPNVLTLLLKATANGLEFGYFNADNPTDTRALLTTADAVGTTVAFTSEFARYGYYIHYLPNQGPTIPADYYKSVVAASVGTEIDALGPIHQHFSLFAGQGGTTSGNYVLGAEDRWGVSNPVGTIGIDELQGDYNDFVVGILAVPEPGTIGLAGLGLALVIGYSRRRR